MTRRPPGHDQTAALVKRELQRLATPEKAKSSAWFFKTGQGQYGEGDEFLGVTVSEQRKVAWPFRDLPLSEIAKLLKSPIHEHRLTALLILVDQFERAMKDRILGSTLRVEPRTIVDFYLTHRSRVNNWDLVDSSAPQILGQWLLKEARASYTSQESGHRPNTSEVVPSRAMLYNLARSSDLWEKRIAMITTHAFIKAGEFEDALAIAGILVHDSHDLIHKAVGWMLREVGKQDRTVLEAFLDRHAAAMPRTMLRYAIEKLEPEARRAYLGAQQSQV